QTVVLCSEFRQVSLGRFIRKVDWLALSFCQSSTDSVLAVSFLSARVSFRWRGFCFGACLLPQWFHCCEAVIFPVFMRGSECLSGRVCCFSGLGGMTFLHEFHTGSNLLMVRQSE